MDLEFRLDEAARLEDCEPCGTLESWKTNVIDAIDPEWGWHFAFGAMVGCAGSLLRLVGLPSSGFYLHGPSSGGKSLTQVIQTGIWGNPALGKGLCHTCRSTPNAVESIAIRGNDTTLAMDEARNAAAGTIGEFVFMFASGRGKNRARRDGSGLTSTRHEWVSLATLSGEEPLDVLLKKNPRAGTQQTLTGHTVRMPTVLIPEGRSENFAAANCLEAAARAHYGHAGLAFVRHLFARSYPKDANELRNKLDRYSEALAGDTKSVPKLRAVRAFAVVWVAGDLMREAGLLPNRLEPEKIVRLAWASFADSEASSPLEAAREAADAVVEWLYTHPGQVRPLLEDADHKSWHETWAWSAGKEGSTEVACFYVRKDRLSDMYGGTVPTKSVLKQLRERGILIPMNAANHDNVWTHLPDGKRSPVKHYRLEIELPASAGEKPEEAPSDPLERGLAFLRGR